MALVTRPAAPGVWSMRMPAWVLVGDARRCRCCSGPAAGAPVMFTEPMAPTSMPYCALLVNCVCVPDGVRDVGGAARDVEAVGFEPRLTTTPAPTVSVAAGDADAVAVGVLDGQVGDARRGRGARRDQDGDAAVWLLPSRISGAAGSPAIAEPLFGG